ncbi:hypothetical protein H6G98_31640 [Nostoc sp. FACHB-857]|nr:hypothetical protein [Nostoc sp. FACHB-857]
MWGVWGERFLPHPPTPPTPPTPLTPSTPPTPPHAQYPMPHAQCPILKYLCVPGCSYR